jgi:hypothetical protein
MRPKVFISYSAVDRGWLNAFVRELQAREVETFLDTLDISPGELWRDRLEAALLGSAKTAATPA